MNEPELINEPDWDAIRAEYEKTEMSVLALAKKYGVPLHEIEKKRAAQGWRRDEQREIMEIVATKTVMGDTGVLNNGRAPHTEQERMEAIERAADNLIGILQSHKDAARLGIDSVMMVLQRIRDNQGKVEIINRRTNEIFLVDATKPIKELAAALAAFVEIDRKTYALDEYRGAGSPHEIARRGEDEYRRQQQLLDDAMTKLLNKAQRHLHVVK